MDWSNWKPQQRANLCFIVRDAEVLLIRKKRGLGAGKINGPGGKIDAGETARASAVRETEEELHVTPVDPQLKGELFFQFRDGYSLHCAVFRADQFTGKAQETDEAVPLWTPLDAIPYDAMWEDDRHWLPLLLSGRCFRGYFEFQGDRMISCEIQTLTQLDDSAI